MTDRSKKNNKRETNGYDSVDLFTSTVDLMEYIEITSTCNEDISLNDEYEIYYGDIKMTVTDMNGGTDITISKGQAVVLWNYRDDVTSTIPTEEQFREEMRIPDDAVVLKVTSDHLNWGITSTFSIKRVSDGETVSAFTATKAVNTDDGLAVELKIPNMGSEMEVYRNLTTCSAGTVYFGQLNGLVDTNVPDEAYAKGVYITEINANDVERSDKYGTASDVMECIEVVNTTDHDIDLNSDYSVYYTIKEASRKHLTLYHYDSAAEGNVGSSEGCIIPAGGTAVLWCYRAASLTDYTSFPTEEDFRETYGISDDVNVYIFTNQNGLNNTVRTFEIFQNNPDGGKTLVSSYSYQGGGVDLKDNKSVHLSVNPEGPEMLIYTANGSYGMGYVSYNQYKYIQDDGSKMGLTLNTSYNEVVPASVDQGNDYRVYWTYTQSTLSRVGITTYYRFDGEGSWYSKTETSRRVPNLYETLISADEIFSHDYLEFYVCAENTYHKTYSQVYKVYINKLNSTDTIRTSVSEGEEVNGTVSLTASNGADNANTKIYVDGAQYEATYMLDDGAYLTFSTTGRDSYFKTALTTTDNEIIAPIGKWQYTILDGQAINIDSSLFTYNEANGTYDITLRFWAGTYGTTVDEYLVPDANRDDLYVTQLALRLINGNTYYPTAIGPDDEATSTKTNLSTDFNAKHAVGDSAGWSPYLDVSFSVPASEVTAVGTTIDTTKLSDGEHTLKVTDGEKTTEVTFVVDNTAPVIDLGIEDGESLTGVITIDPQVTDANTLNDFVVLLDGEQIDAPYETTAYELGEGEHTLTAYADDAAGNYSTKTVTFTVTGAALTLTDGGTTDITGTSASLYLTLESAADAEVTFYNAEKIEASGITTNTTSGILPYIQYTINTGDADDDDIILANWDGTASNSDDTHASTMYVLNTATGAWDEVAKADAEGSIKEASFTAKDHVKDGTATVIIQCTADSALPQLDTTTDGNTAEVVWDGNSVPEDYDFAFAWESDTQYYAEEWQSHFLNINNWIVNNADDLGIKYVMHTGDIVDDYDMIYQWENADEAMSILDDAGIPYGVLGGNHDVAAGLEDYENYYTYFGTDRFESQATYGGSYQNNAGHYDLISEGGQDFIIVYMSWNIYQDELDWMNEVLQQYSDRKAILCFHTYTRVAYSSGSLLDYYGELVQEQVVAKNPNVFMVLNDHYHGSSYQTIAFDDNGDGVKERTVYQICTDYQSGFEGGNEYIKLLYFDLDNNKIYINSYSPCLDDYNYYDAESAVNINQDGLSDIGVDAVVLDVEFNTTEQSILETQFSAYVCKGDVLGTANLDANTGVASINLTGLEKNTQYTWYAVAENANTGYLKTGLYSFTTASNDTTPDTDPKEPETPETPTDGKDGSTDTDKDTGKDTDSSTDKGSGSTADGTADGGTPSVGDNGLAWPIAAAAASATGIGCMIVIRNISDRRKRSR